jgi:hypothetical protein
MTPYSCCRLTRTARAGSALPRLPLIRKPSGQLSTGVPESVGEMNLKAVVRRTRHFEQARCGVHR